MRRIVRKYLLLVLGPKKRKKGDGRWAGKKLKTCLGEGGGGAVEVVAPKYTPVERTCEVLEIGLMLNNLM
jgi:hypothetical protein